MTKQKSAQIVTVLAALATAITAYSGDIGKVVPPQVLIIILLVTNIVSAVLPSLKEVFSPSPDPAPDTPANPPITVPVGEPVPTPTKDTPVVVVVPSISKVSGGINLK